MEKIFNMLAIVIIFSVFANCLMRGMVTGWTAPAINKLKNGEHGLSATDQELSWIASLESVGRFFGSVLMGLTVDRLGRKYSIVICSVSFFILWLPMIFIRSIILMCLLRLLMGITQGMHDVVNSIYLVENLSPKMRGIMSSTRRLCQNIGLTIENILVTYASYSTAPAASAMIGCCMFLATFFAKETPYFLMTKGRHEDAKQNLLWLRGQRTFDKDTLVEFDKIQQNMQSEMLKKRLPAMGLTSSENYRPLLTIMICHFSLVFVGCCSIVAYSSIIFLPSSIFSPKEFTILLGIFDLLCACILPIIMEKFNRRTLLLNFLLITVICNACTYVFYSMTIWKEWLSWAIFITVTLQYIIGYWAICTMETMRSELLPMSMKGVGGCLCVMANALAIVISVRMFLPITTTFGIQYKFLLFMVTGIIAFAYIYKVLPETRGKTLVDIQLSLQSKLIK